MTRPPRSHKKPGPRDVRAAPTEVWLWGAHAVTAALANPARQVHALYATRNAARDLPPDAAAQEVSPRELDGLLPPGAVHQGLAARAAPLEPVSLDELLAPARGLLVLLDQVTDPHNVGAVLRSAAAFGARGLILQDRKAPPFSGGCAKAAVGAAERVAHARVANLSRALEAAREAGWRTIGLAGDASTTLEDALENALGDAGDAVLVALGAEDKGLRPSVRDACEVIARIPIAGAVESLNVSNAAALALYLARRKLGEER